MENGTVSGWIRSNILGFVAIFIALTGSAYAIDGPLPGQDQVGSADIINGEVATPDLGADAVTSGKIGTGQVTGTDLRASSVTGAKVADGSLDGADIAPSSLGAAQVDEASLDSSVLQHRLASGCAAGSAIRDVDAAGNVTCEGTGGGGSGGPPTGPAGGALTGNYPDPAIAANAVGSSEIAADGVGSSEIANSAVGAAEIAQDSVGSSELQGNAVFGANVVDDTLKSQDIDESSLDIAVGKTAHDNSACFGGFDGLAATCGTLNVTLPRAEHVMLIASGEWVTFEFDDPNEPSDPGNSAQADCHLEADGSLVGSEVNFGEKQASFGATPVHDFFFPGNFTVTGVTSTLSAGSHVLTLHCFDDDGFIEIVDTRITAVTLD